MKRSLLVMVLSSLAIPIANAQEPATVSTPYKVAVAEAPTNSVTPDGRFRLYAEEAGGGDEQLFLRDLTTGESRRLTAGPGTASEAILSPDGTLIAYTWVNPAYGWATEDRLIELWIVGIDGSGPRTLYSNSDVFAFSGARLNRQFNPPLRIHEWSSDGKYVAAALYQEHQAQLVLFSVEDDSVRVLRTQPLETLSYSSYFTKLRFSPDGRFVAYDPTPGRDSPRDIFVIPAEGGSEVPLVQHQDNDILLDWTPDGRGVLFASDRSGHWDLWLIQVLDGGPRGIARMVYPNIGPFSSGLGFNRDGSYYYGVTVWENDVYVANLDPASYRLGRPTKLVSHVGYRTSTQWSRDGRYLAYAWGNASASGVGSESDPFVLGIRSLDTGQESRLRLGELLRHGGHGFDPQWSSDGHFIIVDARERDYLQGQGLYRVDVQTGTVTPAVRTDVNRGYNRIESSAWSSDGRVIFERRPPQRIMTRDLQTGEERELYRPVPPAQIHHWPTSNLAVSPDGQRLAFVWSDGKTVERIFALMVLPTAGGEPREILRTQGPARIGVPAWTPDSRQIIYARSVTGEEGMFEFWRIPAEGGEPQNLGLKMEARVPYGLSVHPDGTRIAFTAGTERGSEIRVLDNFLPAANPDRSVSGTNEEDGSISLAAPARGQHGSNSRVTRTAASPEFEFQAEDHIQNVARLREGRVVNVQPLRHLTWSHGYDPSVSPDGRLVAFATSIRDKAQMWTTPFEASDTRWQPLTPVEFPHDSAHPTWSPDGRAIAFFVPAKGIWLMSASGADLRQVTYNTVRDGYPRWFPDGRRLAFTRIVGADRVEDIWMIDLDSRVEYQLTTNPADEGASTISPDGRYLSFSSDRGGQTDLWILPMAEGEAAIRQFTNDGGRGPDWSPDGKWITYGCPISPTSYALCLKAVSGGPVIQVTDGLANDFNPSWSPDGNSVVVSQNSGLAVVDVSAIVR